jgi:hypothetical protein
VAKPPEESVEVHSIVVDVGMLLLVAENVPEDALVPHVTAEPTVAEVAKQ